MYGDPPILDIRTRLKQWACWHTPVKDIYMDYTCSKCKFSSDKPLSGISLRHLWWLITGRMP